MRVFNIIVSVGIGFLILLLIYLRNEAETLSLLNPYDGQSGMKTAFIYITRIGVQAIASLLLLALILISIFKKKYNDKHTIINAALLIILVAVGFTVI